MTSLDIVAKSGNIWWNGFQFLEHPPIHATVIFSAEDRYTNGFSIDELYRLFDQPPLTIQGSDADKACAIYEAYSHLYKLTKPPMIRLSTPSIVSMCECTRQALAELDRKLREESSHVERRPRCYSIISTDSEAIFERSNLMLL